MLAGEQGWGVIHREEYRKLVYQIKQISKKQTLAETIFKLGGAVEKLQGGYQV